MTTTTSTTADIMKSIDAMEETMVAELRRLRNQVAQLDDSIKVAADANTSRGATGCGFLPTPTGYWIGPYGCLVSNELKTCAAPDGRNRLDRNKGVTAMYVHNPLTKEQWLAKYTWSNKTIDHRPIYRESECTSSTTQQLVTPANQQKVCWRCDREFHGSDSNMCDDCIIECTDVW